MPHSFEKMVFLVGDQQVLEQMRAYQARPLFDAQIVGFLDAVAKHIFNNPLAKVYPDVISFAFWCRRSSVLQMRKVYPDLSARRGRGVAFHIAPSNVAVNFAYSLVAGLLSGNANIVRVPSRDFPQVTLICDALNAALQQQQNLVSSLCLVRYDRDKAINDTLSTYCHSRLIWGGDATIATLRESPLRPRSIDIAFANRYSIALIDATAYLGMPDKQAIAERFYNDTFLTDQNACTSPGLVVWLGASPHIATARDTFWATFDVFSQQRYHLQEVMAIRKFNQFCLLSSERDGVTKASGPSNLVYRVQLDTLDDTTMDRAGAGGYFLEYLAQEISDIYPVCGERCQTLSVLGVESEAISAFLSTLRPAGIDRVVSMGKSMDFSLQWDGYDLIYTLSRCISIAV